MLRAATTLLAVLALSSCAQVAPAPEVPTAPMDVALDIAGQGIFYKGTAHIPRGFNSATSFQIAFALTHGSHPYGGGIGFDAHAALGDTLNEAGIYQPLAGDTGVISLRAGRLLLRGTVGADGQALAGDWFFDGKPGGSFRIAREGTIFL